MAAAGVPSECADHAERIAYAAISMIKPIELPEEPTELVSKAEVKLR